MRVLFATSELYPFVKTGGLGDVAAGLPPALRNQGVDIRYFLPGYAAIKTVLASAERLHRFPDLLGQRDVTLLRGVMPDGLTAYVLDAPSLYDRPHPYLDETGQDWPDNHLRWSVFCLAAVQLAQYDGQWQADIIHGNDWQCGLIPAYARFRQESARHVLTIHNIGYQGLFPAAHLRALALPPESFTLNGLEYYGQIGFLKAGLYYADLLTTVSPTYAREIRTTTLGCGLEGLLAGRGDGLRGILNGIDNAVWNPETDPALCARYTARAIAPRRRNKTALLKEIGIKGRDKDFLLGFVGRLTPQKGIDILLQAAPDLIRQGATLLVLASGDKDLEISCRDLAVRYPAQFIVHLGYDEGLAHRIQSGCDAVIVPSHFEPCGLVQLYALRYGAVPIVRRTGGLADSVTPQTGFLFDGADAASLSASVQEAMALFAQPRAWQKMQKTGMGQDFSWNQSARIYNKVYASVLDGTKAASGTPASSIVAQ